MRKLPNVWLLLIWCIMGFLMAVSGMALGKTVQVIIGAALAFAGVSTYTTFQVKSDSGVKKALEVISAIIAMAIVVLGYAITGSLILGFLTCFVVVMFLVVFALSYFLPKLRGKSHSTRR